MIDVNDLLFHKPDRTYSERTAGYVNIGDTERIAVMLGGLVHAPKAMLYCRKLQMKNCRNEVMQ